MSDEREQKIRDRAYALWEADGGQHGNHDQHWHDAVREVDGAESPAPKAKKAAAPRKTVKKEAAEAAPELAAIETPAPATAKPARKPRAVKPKA